MRKRLFLPFLFIILIFCIFSVKVSRQITEFACERGDGIDCIDVHAVIDGGEAVYYESYSVKAETALMLSFTSYSPRAPVEFYSDSDLVVLVFDKNQKFLYYRDQDGEGGEFFHLKEEGSYYLLVISYYAEDAQFFFQDWESYDDSLSAFLNNGRPLAALFVLKRLF